MKHTFARMGRRALSLLLVCCLMLSMVGTAFATEPTKKYVSLGDSMTNGYGLSGYGEVNGFLEEVADAYPAQLAEEMGWDLIAQLAISAMRAEDLHFILDYGTEGAYPGDPYTQDEFVEGRFNDYLDEMGDASKSGVDNVSRIFQENVADADVISMAVGNANFGVFLLGRITGLLGVLGDTAEGDEWIDFNAVLSQLNEEDKAVVMNVYNQVMDAAKAYLPAEYAGVIDALGNVIGYTVASYVLNVNGALDRIVELNPDAEIIIVGIMNTFAGMDVSVEIDGVVQTIDMGIIMAPVIESMNAYLAALPAAKQAKGLYPEVSFCYAEADNVAMLVSEYKTEIKNTESVIRKRFVDEVVDTVFAQIPGMGLVEITLEDVVAYEAMSAVQKVGFAAQNTAKATSIAVYLAFEQAILASTDLEVLDAAAFMALASGLDDIFAGVFAGYDANLTGAIAKSVSEKSGYWNEVSGIVLAQLQGTVYVGQEPMAEFLFQGAEDDTRFVYADLQAMLMDILVNGENAAFKKVANAIALDLTQMSYDTLRVLGMAAQAQQIKGIAEEVVGGVANGYVSAYTLLETPDALGAALCADNTVFSLLHLFARMLIGNGIGCHPSAAGHDTLTAAIAKAYNEGYTPEDALTDKTIEAAKIVVGLIAEYYDEAYAYAYAEAKEAGYIDDLVAGIDDVIAQLMSIDVSGTEMTDEFKAELAGEIEEIVEILNAAKALVLEADVLDQAALDALVAMLDEAGEAIENLKKLAVQAGVDVNQLAIIPALEDAYAKLVDEVLPTIDAKLQAAVAAGTAWLMEKAQEAYDALVDAIVEALPAADEFLYDWLYNNPEKVIAFFNEYGDDMINFLDEYKEEIGAVLGYIVMNYGEEVAEFVMEHPAEILKAMVEWCDTYGEKTWAMIDVYLEALGVYDIIGEGIANVENQFSQMLDLLDAKTAEAVKAAVAKLQQSIADVLDQADELKEQVKDQIEDLTEKLETLEKDLADKKAELENAAEDAKAEIEAAIKEIEAAIAQTEAEIAKLQQQLIVIAEKAEALFVAVLGLNDAVETMIAEGLNAGMVAIQSALNNVGLAAVELAGAIAEEAAAEMAKAVEEIKGLLNKIYIENVTDNYVITEDSYYVALGDADAYGKSADLLTQAMGMCNQHANLTVEGMTAAALLANMDVFAEEIEKADMITVGFGANVFTGFVASQVKAAMYGREIAEMDWVALLGEDGAAAIAEELAEMKADFVAEGVSETYADIMALAVESYAFSYMVHLATYAAAVEEIHAINPEALVVLVGMYNPMNGVIVDLGESQVDLGEYLRYLVDLSNVYSLSYAILADETIFVDAPAVETNSTGRVVSVVNFVAELVYSENALEAYNPTEAGYEYIKEQILKALNPSFVATGLLGDADNNGEVDYIDAMLILQYHTGVAEESELNLCCCDVDKSGEVDYIDAMMVLQYHTGVITEF